MVTLKAILQAIMTVLAALVPGLAGPMTLSAWINVVVLAAGAVMVYNATNVPGWAYAKLIASATSAVAVVLVSSLADGISAVEWIQMALAAAAALGVGAVPNARAVPATREG